MKKIYLASSSENRKELLKRLGIDFSIVESKYQEDMQLKLDTMELARHLSRGKTEAVDKSKLEEGVIIAADTFASLKGELLGKPQKKSDAKKMLVKISGEVVDYISGYSILDSKSDLCVSKATKTKVYFKSFDDETIDNYIKTGEPIDKAGGFGIQGIGALLVDKIEGDQNTIIGLPIAMIADDLKEFGIRLL